MRIAGRMREDFRGIAEPRRATEAQYAVVRPERLRGPAFGTAEGLEARATRGLWVEGAPGDDLGLRATGGLSS